MKHTIVALMTSAALAGCAAEARTVDFQHKLTGQMFTAISVMDFNNSILMLCPVNHRRIVVSKCAAQGGASVPNNVLTALSGSMLPAFGSFFAKGYHFNISSGSLAMSAAEATANVRSGR